MMEARLAVARGDFDAARARLAELEPVDDEREPMWRAVAEQLRSLAELCSGHFDYALGTARRAIAFADKAAAPDDESIQMRCLEAYCLAAVNDGNAAAAAFRDAGGRASPMQSRQAMLLADMAAADALIAAGRRADAKPFVGRALVEARSVDYPAFFWPVPDVAARVCALALESGIETDYVRSLIRERGLPPPANAPASWPWKCRVSALGGFRVEQDGRRLATDGARASGKPTELLRAIVALGGRRVGVERLVSLLWPGEGRVGARSAFNVTLLRLRRLLGADSLVVLSEGEVSLDPRHATVDRWQLEAALAAAEVAGDDALGAALAGVVDGYPGPLLPDDGASWVEAERRRLRLRVDAVLARAPRALPASTPRRCCRARWRRIASCRWRRRRCGRSYPDPTTADAQLRGPSRLGRGCASRAHPSWRHAALVLIDHVDFEHALVAAEPERPGRSRRIRNPDREGIGRARRERHLVRRPRQLLVAAGIRHEQRDRVRVQIWTRVDRIHQEHLQPRRTAGLQRHMPSCAGDARVRGGGNRRRHHAERLKGVDAEIRPTPACWRATGRRTAASAPCPAAA